LVHGPYTEAVEAPTLLLFDCHILGLKAVKESSPELFASEYES